VNAVIGGFHLIGMNVENLNSKDFLNELLKTLVNNNVEKYYTCHCTGEQAYSYLSQKISNLNEIKTGMVIEV
jgi:7,8-dihydropterin-6-yl-methyl-4-(beta-D-ribofuranosyl)aminobenzene 5'-phosphate synthase